MELGILLQTMARTCSVDSSSFLGSLLRRLCFSPNRGDTRGQRAEDVDSADPKNLVGTRNQLHEEESVGGFLPQVRRENLQGR